MLNPNRFFSAEPLQREAARQLYVQVASLPLICPHGHVNPRLFADPNFAFGTPTELLIWPDHYVFRMLYSQGISLERLGIPRSNGDQTGVETDHRKIWQTFAAHFYLFRGTPTGIWLAHELRDVFGVTMRLTAESGQVIYDQIAECLARPEFRPRALFERFNIEVLCTTDAATDSLDDHRKIRESGWRGRVLPTFRPDALLNLETPNWKGHLEALSQVSGIEVSDYKSFLAALRQRRAYFKAMGAVATDHGAPTAYTGRLSDTEVEAIFGRVLRGQLDPQDSARFMGHMLIQMAEMSIEDGLVMQLHVGSVRNHNTALYQAFGPDMGADMPRPIEFTRDLQPLLSRVGNDVRLTLILFTLDESTYARELAPLAGHYPALRLGPPWWFHDSWNGMQRYFDQVIETASLYNTAGFNDDTRAFPSIPARHDLWRRAAANWLGGLVARQVIDITDARAMIVDCAVNLAKRTYKLG